MADFVYTPTRFMLPDSHYNKKKADHAVTFIEQLKHIKTSEWAGKNFTLLPWQEQIVRDIFGVVKLNGARQFRHCFVEVPKKSGKSELAAAIALYLLCADQEQGAEIYSVANDREQAAIVFNLAQQMALDNPALRKLCKFVDSRKRIIFTPTRSFYAAISSEIKNKYGLNVHGCVFDELLGQSDRKLYDTMTIGSGSARRQPLNFVITTAGNDKTSICYEEHCYAMDLLHGRKADPRFYPVVFAADDEDDWTNPAVWKRVNPSFGVTVPEEFYHDFFRRAEENVSLEAEFRQFFLNQWLSSTHKWLPMDKYDKCGEPFDPETLKDRPCYAGLDLASSDDIAALVLVFPPDEPNGEYFVLPFFWIPRENMQRRVRRDHVMYDKWEREGFINTTEGNVIYYDFIEKKIEELSRIYNIRQVLFDKWGAIQMAQNLEGENFDMVDFRQGYKSLSPPSKELYRLILDEKFRHGGNPALRWMFENVYIEMDAAGNIKPNKKKSTEKIDGAVAAIMALEGAIRRDDEKKSRGGIVIYDADTDTLTRNGIDFDEW
ncbi:MAG: terminase large subunit [Oscillospiraceae bacterium]|jgi:phage terminase large subunit-like protein|nr:terminase large subunit [Oscillospiraceae bacterium]